MRERLAAPGWDPTLKRLSALLVIAASLVPAIRAKPNLTPYPDAPQYADSARQLASGHGYFETVERRGGPMFGNRPERPLHPPGYPVALVPFAKFGSFPSNVQLGAKFYTLLWLVVCAWAAWRIGGAGAAALVAPLLGVSAFARDMASIVMSDPLAALLVVVPVALLTKPTGERSFLSGAALGAAAAVRMSHAVFLAALLVAVPRHARRKALAGAAPFVLALLIYQAVAFGNPLRTGYTTFVPKDSHGLYSFDHLLGRDNLYAGPEYLHFGPSVRGRIHWWSAEDPKGILDDMPSALLYPLILFGIPPVYYPPLTGAIGVWFWWRRRRHREGRYALLSLLLMLVPIVSYYYVAVRFAAPGASILAIGAAAQVAEWTRLLAGRLRRAARSPVVA